MSRKPIPKDTETAVLTSTRRRCPLCCYVNHDDREKKGQIAHINKNRDDHRFDNLVWLCFDHHSEFDSTTSQHKNYSLHEVKLYRDRLISVYEKGNQQGVMNFVLDDSLNLQSLFFNGICSCASISNIEDVDEFYLRIKYRLYDKKYGGTLLTLLDKNSRIFLRLRCFEEGHSDHSNELVLYSYNNDSPIKICAINILDGWNELLISVSRKAISLKNNFSSTFAYQINFVDDFSRVEIANICAKEQKWDPLACFVSSFSLINMKENKPLYNFTFEFGEDEFLSQKGSRDLEFVNFNKDDWGSA